MHVYTHYRGTLFWRSLTSYTVYFQIRHLSRQMLPHDAECGKRIRSQGQAAQSIAIIVVLFVVSWIPLYTINTVVHFCKDCKVPFRLLQGCIILTHLNSAWNPILYAWGMRDFREGLRKLFYLARGRRHREASCSKLLHSHANGLNGSTFNGSTRV